MCLFLCRFTLQWLPDIEPLLGILLNRDKSGSRHTSSVAEPDRCCLQCTFHSGSGSDFGEMKLTLLKINSIALLLGLPKWDWDSLCYIGSLEHLHTFCKSAVAYNARDTKV